MPSVRSSSPGQLWSYLANCTRRSRVRPCGRSPPLWGRAGETEQASRAYSSAVDLLSIHGRRADAAVAGEEWAALLAATGQRERAGRIQARARTLAARQEAA